MALLAIAGPILFADSKKKSKANLSLSSDARAEGARRMRWSMSLILAQRVVETFLLLWIVASRRGALWRLKIESLRAHRVARDAIYVAIILLCIGTARAPFAMGRYLVLRSFHMTNVQPAEWLVSTIGFAALVIALVTFLTMILFRYVRAFPSKWPFMVALVVAPLSLLVALWSPFFSELFQGGQALPEGDLKQRLTRVAKACRLTRVPPILIDMNPSPKAEAHFEGLIKKRITIGKILIDEFPDDEIAFVVAHEIGHDSLRHLWLDVWVETVGWLLVLWLVIHGSQWAMQRFSTRIGLNKFQDTASFPLIVLSLFLVLHVTRPLECARGRWMEAQADRYALEHAAPAETGPEAAIRSLNRLNQMTRSDPNPPLIFWLEFFNHPALDERVAAIRELSTRM